MPGKTKMTFALSCRELIRQRAAEDGIDMGTYIDRLVHRDDLRRRIRADEQALREAGYYSSAREERNAAIIAAMRSGR